VALIEPPGRQTFGNSDMIQHHIDSHFDTTQGSNKQVFDFSASIKPKVFSFSPLPKDQLLHEWFSQNNIQFAALLQSVRESVSMEIKSYAIMRETGKDMIWYGRNLFYNLSFLNLT
jgi:hypothetical protein